MAAPRHIPKDIQTQVRQRANGLCEYCHASEKWQYVEFTIEHVFPLNKNGAETVDNLALACFHCNRKKSDKTTAIDSKSGVEVPLFNPRIDIWSQHFIWSIDTLYIIASPYSQ